MTETDNKDPLHGLTLEKILNLLVDAYGWEGLAEFIPVKCFSIDPSIKSSLIFLRRTPWARAKVEALFLGKLRRRRSSARGRDAALPSADSPKRQSGETKPARGSKKGSTRGGGRRESPGAKPE